MEVEIVSEDAAKLVEQLDIVRILVATSDTEHISRYHSAIANVTQYIEMEATMLQPLLGQEVTPLLQLLNQLRIDDVAAAPIVEALQKVGAVALLETLQKHVQQFIQHPYERWLKAQSATLTLLNDDTQPLMMRYRAIQTLVQQMETLFGPQLYARCTRNDTKIIFQPVMCVNDEWVSLAHPVTQRPWHLSGNHPLYKNALRQVCVGDIIQVGYDVVADTPVHYYDELIALQFEHFHIVGEKLDRLLAQHFTASERKIVERQLDVLPRHTSALIKEMARYVLPQSTIFDTEINAFKAKNETAAHELQTLEQQHADLEAEKIKQTAALSKAERQWLDIYTSLAQKMDEPRQQAPTKPYDADHFIADLQSRIYAQHEDGLLYERPILQLLMHALQANILTILTGPSGTGKSSLVQAVGEAIANVHVTMVPVQSSWTDTQDLLGYFHPTEKMFIATPFMEALAKAKMAERAGRDELHIICLDEMNLAHVEYYFAQFLSVREQMHPTISLYPAHYEQWALAVHNGDIVADAYTKQIATTLLERYPAQFTLPKNVRFVGTLNMDHTVQALSPKVIDRSLFIELLSLTTAQKQQCLEQVDAHRNELMLTVPFQTIPTYNVDESALTSIHHIANQFAAFRDVPFQPRAEKQLRQLLCYDEAVDDEQIDLLIKGKLLPRIELKKTDIVHLPIAEMLTPYPRSKAKWEMMMQTMHTVSFW